MLEFITTVILEGALRYLVVKPLELIKWFGVLVLKLLFHRDSKLIDLNEKYKDSSKPYFIGTFLLAAIIYAIMKAVT